MACEDVALTGPCLEAEFVDGALVLNIEADGVSIQCTDEGLQAVGGGFNVVQPVSWTGLTPSCICTNAVRPVNGGTELFAPELYAFNYTTRDGLNYTGVGRDPGETFANVIGVPLANQPGDPSQFHPIFGWDAARHQFSLGSVGSPILNPFCRPMFLWFLIRTRVTVNSGAPSGTLVHKSSVSLNGGGESQFVDLTMPRSNTVDVTYGSSVMRTPPTLVGLQIPPGGSFYVDVFNWVDQFQGNFDAGNLAFDSEITIDALALAYSGNPPASGCPVVTI